jgi:hypothetical protein
LQLPHFAWLGLKGFAGSALWLLLPTVLLANANHPRTGFAGLSIFLGVLIAVPVFMILPMLQIQFAVDGRLASYGTCEVLGRECAGHLWHVCWRCC